MGRYLRVDEITEIFSLFNLSQVYSIKEIAKIYKREVSTIIRLKEIYDNTHRTISIYNHGYYQIAKLLAHYLSKKMPRNPLLKSFILELERYEKSLEGLNLEYVMVCKDYYDWKREESYKKHKNNELLEKKVRNDCILPLINQLFLENEYALIVEICNNYVIFHAEDADFVEFLLKATFLDNPSNDKTTIYAELIKEHPHNMLIGLKQIEHFGENNDLLKAVDLAFCNLSICSENKAMQAKLKQLLDKCGKENINVDHIINANLIRIAKSINKENFKRLIKELIVYIKLRPDDVVFKNFLLEIFYNFGISEEDLNIIKTFSFSLNSDDFNFLSDRIISVMECSDIHSINSSKLDRVCSNYFNNKDYFTETQEKKYTKALEVAKKQSQRNRIFDYFRKNLNIRSIAEKENLPVASIRNWKKIYKYCEDVDCFLAANMFITASIIKQIFLEKYTYISYVKDTTNRIDEARKPENRSYQILPLALNIKYLFLKYSGLLIKQGKFGLVSLMEAEFLQFDTTNFLHSNLYIASRNYDIENYLLKKNKNK